jgi:hypothetical protein
MGAVVTLGLDYRWRPVIGLEAKYSDDPDADHYWRKSLLPSVDAAASVPGELEKMIAARDRALPEEGEDD